MSPAASRTPLLPSRLLPSRLLPSRLRRARRVLILGGARSGKSSFAESLLAGGTADYLACGPVPDGADPEWADRVARHRERRPDTWHTVETVDLPAELGRPGPPVLLDCLTTWLARTMDDSGVWSGAPGADQRLTAAVDALLTAWRTTPRRIVAVSNEVGSGIVPATASGRRFRDAQGILNTRVAAASDRVWLVTAGIPRRLR